MESEGLVEMKVEVQDDRPNRKVYSITDSGRRELLEWLAKPAEREQVREPILIKVFFGSSLSKQRTDRTCFENCADETRATAVTYLEYAHQFVDKFVESLGLAAAKALFWQLTIDCGLKVHRAELEWAEEAIRRIEAADDSMLRKRTTRLRRRQSTSAPPTKSLDRVKSLMPGALSGPDTYLHPATTPTEQPPAKVKAKVAGRIAEGGAAMTAPTEATSIQRPKRPPTRLAAKKVRRIIAKRGFCSLATVSR